MGLQLKRRTFLSLWAASGALALTACATYQPPKLPAKEVAVIAIADNTAKITLSAVDGVGLSSLGGLGGLGERQLTLAPGRRTVTVTYAVFDSYGQTKGYSRLTFDARAGQRYVVHERSEGSKFFTWITDASGAAVPAIKPAQ